MNNLKIHTATFFIILITIFAINFFFEKEETEEEGPKESFEWWYMQRALPYQTIPPQGLMKAQQHLRKMGKQNSTTEAPWKSIGPTNIAGRMLSLAIDPENPNIIWAGSASGGLWKSTTGGKGKNAWEYVSTGFPVFSVRTIAINQNNPNEMYIGTGEISGYNLGLVGTPGARTTYGLGILKSTDRGATWNATGLSWEFSTNRSVQTIIINPKNPNTLFAATSEGTYKSVDAGKNWNLVHNILMAMDVVINPIDTNQIYVACGQRNTTPDGGIYKSIDAGNSWIKLGNGLPTDTLYGRTSLAISPSQPSTIYASVAHATTHNVEGLYRSDNDGNSWQRVSTVNYVNGQGWYNNIVKVHPTQPLTIYCAGLDIYKSTDGGNTLIQKSFWNTGYGGVVQPDGPEGPATYVHADHHSIVFDKTNFERMFFGCDGGVFETTDGGTTFAGRNGGLVTTQFYNGFANSYQDSLIALGGLQDNGTVKYEGSLLWNKVYGGDGGWCAIDSRNKDILYQEYTFLQISKSIDGGKNWETIFSSNSNDANFIAPFVIAPSNNDILYAGAKRIYKSINGGNNWNAQNILNGTTISCIGVSYTSADTLIVATGNSRSPVFEIFSSTNGGTTWIKSNSPIPNRYPTDIAFDPTNSSVAYITFSGYGTSHVYKTTDAGLTWNDISGNLPDIPTQSIVVDKYSPTSIYVGTDLGIFRTTNGGISWEEWNEGMPPAMVLEVSISEQNGKLRAATFGNGVFERALPTSRKYWEKTPPEEYFLSQSYPNPTKSVVTIQYLLPKDGKVTIEVYDIVGRKIATLVNEEKNAGKYITQWNVETVSTGVYFYRLQSSGYTETKKMVVVK